MGMQVGQLDFHGRECHHYWVRLLPQYIGMSQRRHRRVFTELPILDTTKHFSGELMSILVSPTALRFPSVGRANNCGVDCLRLLLDIITAYLDHSPIITSTKNFHQLSL